jgi:hypothetical protein
MTVWGGNLGMRRGLRDVKLARVRSLSSLVWRPKSKVLPIRSFRVNQNTVHGLCYSEFHYWNVLQATAISVGLCMRKAGIKSMDKYLSGHGVPTLLRREFLLAFEGVDEESRVFSIRGKSVKMDLMLLDEYEADSGVGPAKWVEILNELKQVNI